MDTRRSLDVRRSRAPPRSSFQERRRDGTEETPTEEGFEDVGLNDEPKPAKKKGLFARFGNNDDSEAGQDERPPSSHHHFTFTGRKRAQSKGEGSELKSMPNGGATTSNEVPVEAR